MEIFTVCFMATSSPPDEMMATFIHLEFCWQVGWQIILTPSGPADSSVKLGEEDDSPYSTSAVCS